MIDDRLMAVLDDYKARALSYEAANMEQGKMLNEVIKERDELLNVIFRHRFKIGADADAAIAKSKPAEWICPRCKVDRLKTACPTNGVNCPMVGKAQGK